MKCVWGNGRGNVLPHAGLSWGWHFCELGLLTSELISLSLVPQLPLCFIKHSSQYPTITIATIITMLIIITITVMSFLKPFVQLKHSLFFCLSNVNSSLPSSQFFPSVYSTVLQDPCLLMDTSVIVWTTYCPPVTPSVMKAIYSVLIILMFHSPPAPPASQEGLDCTGTKDSHVSGPQH